jgi:biotin operon repressor
MSSNPFEKIDPEAASILQSTHRDVRLRIEAALRSEPQRADRQLARELEVSRTAIAHIRAALEAQGQIPVRPSLFRVVR